MEYINLQGQYQIIKSDVQARIMQVLEHGQYIMGPEVQALEKTLAEYVGSAHAIAVSNGSDALLLSLMALGIQPGDEVITTPFSFFATAGMIQFLGAKPVFVDIDPRTYNIDVDLIEAAITPRTKAILPVDLFGQCVDYDAIQVIADQHQLFVIADSAQSFGATYRGRRAGSLGDVSCTSFFPSKPLGGYGDSGACFTQDAALAEKLRQLRNHGQSSRYHHTAIGMTARMDSIQAAVLLAKFAVFSDEIPARERAAEYYTTRLQVAGITTPYIEPDNTSVYAQYTIEVENRDALAQALQAQNIPTAVHYPMSMHSQPALLSLGYKAGDYPVTEAAAQRVISLPMHPYLEPKEQQMVIDHVIKFACPERCTTV